MYLSPTGNYSSCKYLKITEEYGGRDTYDVDTATEPESEPALSVSGSNSDGNVEN